VKTATKLDAALSYARRGLRVLPVHSINSDGICTCGDRRCESPGKHPRIREWHNRAITDEATIRAWFTRRGGSSNVAIATGAESGIIVIDIDGEEGGDSFAILETNLGAAPHTVEAISGSGSRHIFLKHPGGRVQNSAGKLAPHVDVRGDGGYIVVEPSEHESGGRYAWNVDHHPDDTQFAFPPASWIEALHGWASRNGNARVNVAEPIIEGKRNETLFKLPEDGHPRDAGKLTVILGHQIESGQLGQH
jgi:hypothetical protein